MLLDLATKYHAGKGRNEIYDQMQSIFFQPCFKLEVFLFMRAMKNQLKVCRTFLSLRYRFFTDHYIIPWLTTAL